MPPRNASRNNRGRPKSKPADPDDHPKDYFEYLSTVTRGYNDPVWFVSTILKETVRKLFPFQEWWLREFYRNRYDPSLPQYKESNLACGMRGGKTAIISMAMVFEYFCTFTLESPSDHYGLLGKQPIFHTVVATTTDTAEDGIFYNVTNMIENTEWSQTWGDLQILSDMIKCDKKDTHMRVMGSWATSAVGRSNRAIALDELDMFEDTAGKRGADQMYSRLRKSTDTFGLDGHVFALSSPKKADGMILTLYERNKNDPMVLALKKPTWEMNPSPDVSEEYLRHQYRNNMAEFYRDYACEPGLAGSNQFPEGVFLSDNAKNYLVNLPREGDWSHSEEYSVLSIDPAATKDRFGIATAIQSPETGDTIVNGVIGLQKEYGQAYLRESIVIDFIKKVIPRLNVCHMLFDTWMYPGVLEYVEDKIGIPIEKHVVNSDTYDTWLGLQGDGRVIVPFDELLEQECNKLIVTETKTGRKTDHPPKGTKDLADAVANAIWHFNRQEEVDQESIPPTMISMCTF